MQQHTREILEAYGVDIERTLKRFVGKESLMLMFMKELPNDECMPAVLAAREKGDTEAFKAAVHSLKGLSGNLGLTPLFDVTAALMTALREDNKDESERLYPMVLEEFDRAIALVAQIED